MWSENERSRGTADDATRHTATSPALSDTVYFISSKPTLATVASESEMSGEIPKNILSQIWVVDIAPKFNEFANLLLLDLHE